uniref:Disintegrin and metalloproteinase domain-containing protein 9 n=1 Tax=Castor canadensis TaxID=51338 RepID=A0A8B7UM77_CASCN|nr:disintegrin and metalloproteinase domain-containing protein 9 [Castor canadensis]
MGSGAGSPAGTLPFQWLLLCGLVGPVLAGERSGFQQTSRLSSYEIITPWRLTRERREAPRPYSKQVSVGNRVREATGPCLPKPCIYVEYPIDAVGLESGQWKPDQYGWRKKGFGGTAGMAFVGTVCSRSHAGGINVFGQITVETFASIVAHELGHNLGMNHDDGRDCFCGAKSCIMNSGASGSRNFSSCSAEDFEKLTLNKGGNCLLNIPKPDEAYSAPFCGNKLVDPGEECDCGTPKDCELDPCCEGSTCKLKSFAECAYGDCCKDCQFLPGGTLCRGKTNECDVPEYCNGSSQFCQPDVFIQNGYPCQNSKAYCYNGMCQYYDAQCQVIFGSKAKAAPRDCFIDVNSKGDRFGNCGFSGNEYKKCATGNALCGKLQCENVQGMPVFGIVPAIIQSPSRGTTCWGVDFQLGSDVPDPGMVNEGTKCGAGKICRNFQCVNASVLNYDCDVQAKCHGHGVCNSNKNCHCENGWAPPHCESKGYGGSVDSGPTYNERSTALRDGLLVLFFLVVPLIALATFLFIKRDELRKSFFRKKRSQTYESDGKNPASVSRQPVSAPRHVSPMAPSREAPVHANRFPVPTYAAKQPPQFPSRPPPPQPKVSSQGNLIPARPAPAPPLYSSLT